MWITGELYIVLRRLLICIRSTVVLCSEYIVAKTKIQGFLRGKLETPCLGDESVISYYTDIRVAKDILCDVMSMFGICTLFMYISYFLYCLCLDFFVACSMLTSPALSESNIKALLKARIIYLHV